MRPPSLAALPERGPGTDSRQPAGRASPGIASLSAAAGAAALSQSEWVPVGDSESGSEPGSGIAPPALRPALPSLLLRKGSGTGTDTSATASRAVQRPRLGVPADPSVAN